MALLSRTNGFCKLQEWPLNEHDARRYHADRWFVGPDRMRYRHVMLIIRYTKLRLVCRVFFHHGLDRALRALRSLDRIL